ncbi:MAG: hypothetical protein IE889_06050 [Campylobacterales bacterium]|nr:hypothetical protein [Campylobacterales bacterium]
MERFFDENETLQEDEVTKLHHDIAYLLYPSITRALALNKAYKVIVDEQSFIYGREAHIKPVQNIHKSVEIGEATEVEMVMKQ